MTHRQIGEAIGGWLGAFAKAIAWGAGVSLGVLAMWGWMGGFWA